MRGVISKLLVLVLTAGLGCHAAFAQTELQRVWQGDTGGTAYDVEVSGGWAYVSNNDGVAIYDVRRPSQPRFVSLLEIGGVLRLYIVGSTLYAAAPEDGLLIFDIGDPANLRQIGSYGRNVVDVLVHNDIAYLRIMNGGNTEIVDVRDPAHPVELTRMWHIRGAAAGGSDLWVGDPARGLVHMDISDPSSPIERGVIFSADNIVSLELRDDRLYVALHSSGTRVYDVSLPAAPRLLLSYPASGEALDVSGGYPIVCVADGYEGVEVLDASRPSGERVLAREGSLQPHSLYYQDGFIHVANMIEGYVLLRLDQHTPPRRPRSRRRPPE